MRGICLLSVESAPKIAVARRSSELMAPRGKPSATPIENRYLTALWIDKIREFRYKRWLELPL
jgi:hypothetical protein